MENKTFNADIIFIEGLKVSPKSSASAFILLLLIYIFIMVSNIGLVVLISMERSLQEPMYLLFCNMSINDVFGATTIIPRLLSNIFSPITDRYIYYMDCVVQAFSSHFHLSAGAWLVAFILVAILIGLTIRLTRCRRIIINPFCDNASLFKLSCQNLLINHIYGLGSAVVILGSSIGSIALTYLRIAMVCLSSKNKVLNSRALRTCTTHLAVYIIMLVASFTPMIMHRRPEWADSGKVSSVLFHVIPPALNPLIYGLQCKELRHKIIENYLTQCNFV
uniref:G-protein coupled receptors family 1 profile domain-containing protein n=1 Tax=Labrus bergylta TaxID=56723 RepID=A0A3Q3G2S9_9LABR